MAPFNEAIMVREVMTREDGSKVYRGEHKGTFTAIRVPHGGYVMALLIEACLQYQSSSSHPDPVHTAAHYLRATSVGSFKVHVRTIRTGKGLANILADLIQDDVTKVTVHAIFGNFASPDPPPTGPPLTLVPPAPAARVTPFNVHPSDLRPSTKRTRWNFAQYIHAARDRAIHERHQRLTKSGEGAGGVEGGGWYSFIDSSDELTPSALGFFVDLFPDTLPMMAYPDLPLSWFPTVTMSIQFYARIPRESPNHSLRTVGIFTTGRFIDEPMGRHDIYVEVWTAPGDIAGGEQPKQGWREQQRCLAVSHQMALTLPMEVNERKRKPAAELPPDDASLNALLGREEAMSTATTRREQQVHVSQSFMLDERTDKSEVQPISPRCGVLNHRNATRRPARSQGILPLTSSATMLSESRGGFAANTDLKPGRSGEILTVLSRKLEGNMFSTNFGERYHRGTSLPTANKSRSSWFLLVVICSLLTFSLFFPRATSQFWPQLLSSSTYSRIAARYLPVDPRTSEVSKEVRTEIQALFSSNGRTNQVQWDDYSLLLQGQRFLIYSGEFHTYRLPVPSLWPDILQKVKAAGFNAVSVYLHWGAINPAPGVIDFDGYRALEPLYEAAKAAGVWIVLRPGPYINAETTAGGIAHWVTSEVSGGLRTNDTDYKASWQDFIQGVINQTAPYQITEGGPVIAIQIDNEYFQNDITGAYFTELEEAYHNSSIVVPLTYNDPGQGRNFVNGTGAVDLYGQDSYPQGFDCSHPDTWTPVPSNYHDYHENTNPSEPWYFPEFQGGSFDAWGPTAPGYDNCRELTGTDFESVFYRALWASNAKLMSFYMVYGGTSWGAIPFPGVYTSYDYGSAIAENRALTTKYSELKLQGLFLRSSPNFYKTDWIGNSSSNAVSTSNNAAFIVLLRNPDTKSSYWIARQADSTSTDITAFNLTIDTSAGTFQIPQVVSNITLSGRQSKVIVGDYLFGDNSSLLYSTASIFFAGKIGSRDVLFLYGDSDQEHEASLILHGRSSLRSKSPNVSFSSSSGDKTIISFLSGISGLVTVVDSHSQLILYADTVTAGTFWAPVLATNASAPHAHYWQIGTNSTVLVGGPHLVRDASLSDSGTLSLHGDLNSSVRLTLIGPPEVRRVTWNGELVDPDVNAASQVTTVGGFIGKLSLPGAVRGIGTPVLKDWKYANSLPETQLDFDDSAWATANHTTTNIPYKPYYGDGRILYGCDYGFCENIVLWRGHFNATGEEKSVNLSINAFAASVWLNDVFLNTSYGNSTNNRNILEETDDIFSFPNGSLLPGQDNAITIIQDNMGLNETQSTPNTSKSPRGVRGFKLDAGNFSEWKVQGKVGGYTGFPDKTRGVMNEGGLFGERKGWHLPGFDTSTWESRDLSSGLPNNTAGVGFFVTTFDLNIPDGFDVMMSFNFDPTMVPYRALLFVNGWMMGKFVANLGPQWKFPVHEGILEYQGTNTIAVAVWVMESVAIFPRLNVTVDSVLDGGIGGVVSDNPPWSPMGRV
ncbi:hypothetical protein EW146_g4124 [Bondarzewia mesenterica]|uniref:beta-galactosidase n=1 Tax=Bondarzewia mesenterica TaxID=1095465 RepID=A0A4S4LVH6_9AGAM|nr:hypothetical protein EW146_g4124 [Bondarzewia mesenterica]